VTGTVYSTDAKGVRYLENTEGYVTFMGLDEDNEVIGYEFVRMGVMMEKIAQGMEAGEALKAATGTYGRYAEAVKTINPRQE